MNYTKKFTEYSVEALGTAIFVMFILISGFVSQGGQAFIVGFTLIFLIMTFGKFSNAHFNPIVTIGTYVHNLITTRKFDSKVFANTLAYLVAQAVGTIVGYLIAKYVKMSFIDMQIAVNQVAEADIAATKEQLVNQIQLFNSYTDKFDLFVALLEGVASFIFVTVILNTINNKNLKNSAGFVIGLSLFVITVAIGGMTGASLHPFRSALVAVLDQGFGSGAAIHSGIYIVGPIVGAVVAAVLYSIVEMLSADNFKGLSVKIGNPKEETKKKKK